MRQKILALFALLALALTATAQSKIRVSCVGNSVTYGMRLENREQTCYPAQLQLLLGDAYEVRNFGHSGATLMRNGHKPYHTLPECRQALDFKGDIVVIHLGLNDTDPRNYAQRAEEFIPDYRQLIDSLRAVNPSCKLYVCLMTPIFQGHGRFLSGTRDWHALIQDDIRKVAEGAGAQLIDLYTPLHCRPETFPDNLHPDARGARILAETVYAAITGDYPFRLPSYMQSGMVLQRDSENSVSGTAPAGNAVTLVLQTPDGSKMYSTQAAADGKWSVTLPAMPAGGPYTLLAHSYSTTNAKVSFKGDKLLVTSNDKRKTRLPVLTTILDSIYFGELWLCSGQSNMEWINASLPADMRPEICRSGKSDDTDSRIHLLRMEGMRYIGTGHEWTAEQLDSVNELQFYKPYRWQQPTQESVANFSAIGYRVARQLADSLDCHIGVICNAIGGSGIESWIDRTTTEWQMPEVLIMARPANSDFLMDWVRRCIKENTAAATNPFQRHPFDPCYLYETGIAPLEGLTLRGVMWYQGESNAHNLELYARQWKALTTQWRKVFRSADTQPLPFYTMQLAAISGRPSWPRFRNLQRLLADADPNVHLVVSHDVGEQWNVHPSRKDVQAARLAASILQHSYKRDIAGDSPQLTAVSTTNGQLTLTFSEPLTVLPDTPAASASPQSAASSPSPSSAVPDGWFELAGSDGIFHPAAAQISGNRVLLTCAAVPQPLTLRYAWRDFTPARLAGQHSSLPLSTFTTPLAP